jgi:hypothetical protein
MSDVPKHAIIEVGTGTIRYVDFTPEEIQQRELDAIQFATEKSERDAQQAAKDALKVSAKEKLIAGQPLTAEEAETLII